MDYFFPWYGYHSFSDGTIFDGRRIKVPEGRSCTLALSLRLAKAGEAGFLLGVSPKEYLAQETDRLALPLFRHFGAGYLAEF